MKNLTRVLVLALVFAMVLGTVAFADFSDVPETYAHAEAINTLADLGFISGYEDGTFGPEKGITRAEAVTIINNLQGLSQAAEGAKGATPYTDVPADHWASGEINLATQMGVVSGYGDGKFGPEDQVKYEEIVKMVVSALGYEPVVDSKGGWPTGYLVIASEQNITKGLSNSAGDPALRGIVARVVFNALDAPIMEQVGFGRDASYTVMDGKSGNAYKNILTEKNNIYKITGQVLANDVTSLVSGTSPFASSGNEKVRVGVLSDQYEEFDIYGAVNSAGGYVYPTYDMWYGTSGADQKLGYNMTLYVTEDEDQNDDWVILSCTETKGKNSEVTIENVEDIQFSGKYQSKLPGTISVYDEDNDSTNTEYDIAANATLIENGKYKGAASTLLTKDYIEGLDNATITLVDNNRDDYYDYVIVKFYVTDRVDAVGRNNTRISLKNGSPINLDQDTNKNLKYSLTIDGEPAEVKDLQEGDIISYSVDDSKVNYDILVSRKTVTGKVTDIWTDFDSTSDYEYTIGGTVYNPTTLAGSFNSTKLNSVEDGDEGIFYLDAFGKIAYYERTSSAGSDNYSFIISSGIDKSVFGDEDDYTVRILTSEGKVADYTLADRVRVEVNYGLGDDIEIAAETVEKEDLFGAYKDDNGTIHQTATQINIDGQAISTLYELTKSGIIKANPTGANVADYAKRVVQYVANSNGEITTITFAKETSVQTTAGDFTANGNYGTLSYTERTNTLSGTAGDIIVTNDTTIVYAPIDPKTTKDDFGIKTIAALSDGNDYQNVYVYGLNDDGEADAILITKTMSKASQSSNIAVFVRATDKNNADGEKVKYVTFWQGGASKSLYATTDMTTVINQMSNGDVFEYSTDSDSAIDGIETRGIKDEFIDVDAATLTNLPARLDTASGADDAQYVFGVVYRKNGSQISIGTVAGGESQLYRHELGNANVYVLDLTKSTSAASRLVVGDAGDIDKSVFTMDGGVLNVEEDADYTVFIKYWKESVQDVVVIKGFFEKVLGTPVLK